MISFRTAQKSDIPHLAQLVNSAYRGEYSKKGWTTEADLLDGQRTDVESLDELICLPGNQIELALNELGQIVGSVHLKFESKETLYFGMLTVEPTLQGSGLGKLIMNHVESIARKNGQSRIRITVIHHRRELIAYYERRGFRPTGNQEPFPENEPKFGLPKIKDMKLLEFVKHLP